ncbi:hypothetical protein yberc0001_22560 [Yersinia bercovieri ATCC 43970]|uniref:Uncharacterized protein n=2 Tax=Yersinia bercovieri TaxID=634 RepID=A0A2G4TY58_YERBE|nr:hypothetical protein yberc0001_22560 [Yersinia bercovieri ATCC 43970]PHZ25949.1 hypothetical protein CS533_18760 [Yersinia bercovieri]QDW33335.1 hypothetical protein FFE93_009815 [Yersinia sp. KBS0713]
MLLLLVMDYGLTLFYLANSISNDIHCAHAIKQQDILPMWIPTPLLCCRSATALAAIYLIPLAQPALFNPHSSLMLARCCL